jgi:ketosteroid isomerase-like protein
MTKNDYAGFEALNPFFEIVLRGLSGLVDGEHYFDTFADDAIFESRYHFPGWPVTIRGRAGLMASLSGYGKTIQLRSADALVVHRTEDRRTEDRRTVDKRTEDRRVVILEYEVHGEILSSGARYDNRLISVVTIEKRKIVHWRDYMDSLAAWTALNRPNSP